MVTIFQQFSASTNWNLVTSSHFQINQQRWDLCRFCLPPLCWDYFQILDLCLQRPGAETDLLLDHSPSDVDTVRCRVLRVQLSFGQDSAGRPHHPHCVPAEQGVLMIHQLPPETSVGSNERTLLQNEFMSLTEAEALKPEENTETRTDSELWSANTKETIQL